jgi:hypothetical protein
MTRKLPADQRYSLVILAVVFSAVLAVSTHIERTNQRQAIAATSQYLAINPAPLPKFILWIRPESFRRDDLCLMLHQGGLWKQGDNPQKLQEHILWNSRLRIDNQARVPASISTLAMFPHDEQGNITNKFGEDLIYCYILELNPGPHVATFETSSLSKQPFTYSWAIQVSDDRQLQMSIPTPDA